MTFSRLKIILMFVLFGEVVLALKQNVSTLNESLEAEGSSRVLSRKKRYLIFPDGSSFQLVFCCQTPALTPIGDILLYGNTAALAWNLPTDPNFPLMFKDKSNYDAQRRDDRQSITFVDDKGNVVRKLPYNKPRIVNPAFAKRSIDEPKIFEGKVNVQISRKKMHEAQLHRDYLKKNLDGSSIEFHRSNRVELYRKLETLISTLGGDGRQCVLYKLCESARDTGIQGTFLQELLWVVFTLPKGEEFEDDDHKEYDKAHLETEDCNSLYPGCENFQINVT